MVGDFFASKIEHVDRPKLLFSASQTVNVQVIMNQSGTNNFQSRPAVVFPLVSKVVLLLSMIASVVVSLIIFANLVI